MPICSSIWHMDSVHLTKAHKYIFEMILSLLLLLLLFYFLFFAEMAETDTCMLLEIHQFDWESLWTTPFIPFDWILFVLLSSKERNVPFILEHVFLTVNFLLMSSPSGYAENQLNQQVLVIFSPAIVPRCVFILPQAARINQNKPLTLSLEISWDNYPNLFTNFLYM